VPGRDPGFVDATTFAPGLSVEMRYAGADNFVGARIDGYGAARCWLTREAARALGYVQADLAPAGLGLRVYDCYRPQRAVDHFVRWAADPADLHTRARYYPDVPKSRLFEEGYIALRSGHSRGSTVDLTLVRLVDGAPLDMGTPFDFFGPRSHTEATDVTAAQHANRLLLREALERRGFENFPKEWWHYTLRGEPWPDRYFDVPIR